VPPSKQPIPADLDGDLFSREARAAFILPKFRHQGIESHILLAACKAEEVAWECGKRGAFTDALLLALKSLDIRSITYSELVGRFKILPGYVPTQPHYPSQPNTFTVGKIPNVKVGETEFFSAMMFAI
jgi:hypothetical protein